jgi:predicted DNA-binding protein
MTTNNKQVSKKTTPTREKMVSFRLGTKLYDKINKEAKKLKKTRTEYLEDIIVQSMETYNVVFPPSRDGNIGKIRRPMGFQKL